VVFTSGGTEANNLALTGAGRARVFVTAVEHDSVLKATAAEAIPVDSSGVSISANWSACWPRDRAGLGGGHAGQ